MEKEKIIAQIKKDFENENLFEIGTKKEFINHLARLPIGIINRIEQFADETQELIVGLLAGDKGDYLIDLNERWDTFRDNTILQFHAETYENAEIIKNAINKYLLPVYKDGSPCEAYNGQIWKNK